MKYWWVNQNQTYAQEIGGGYMWSPKRNRNNARNQFYENMKDVEPGDIVFSFRNTRISDIGVIKERAIEFSKPSEFGRTGDYWSDLGWYVAVDWKKLSNPVTPNQFFHLLAPTLPTKYSPLNSNGMGQQGVYLAFVPDDMANILLEQAGLDKAYIDGLIFNTDVGDEKNICNIESDIERLILADAHLNSTEKEAIVKSRVGQGKYRKNLEKIEKYCRVTSVTDRRLLRASHIKPWRVSNNYERLDGSNGLLLSPNADLLFDKGYITFTNSGDIIISNRIDPAQLSLLGVSSEEQVNVGAFNSKQSEYLEYHRNQVFMVKK